MSKFGLRNKGNARLSPGEVNRIRERYAGGETQGSLAREFGVSVVQIGRIVRNEVWLDIAPTLPDAGLADRFAKVQEEVNAKMEHEIAEMRAMHPDNLIANMGSVQYSDPAAAILTAKRLGPGVLSKPVVIPKEESPTEPAGTPEERALRAADEMFGDDKT